MIDYTHQEQYARQESVILRRSRRIWAQDERFLSFASQILHFTSLRCVQDDKTRARIIPNPYHLASIVFSPAGGQWAAIGRTMCEGCLAFM